MTDFLARPECGCITHVLEQKAQSHAIAKVVPEHVSEVRGRRLRAAVKDRLTKEITYWDHRAEQLKLKQLLAKKAKELA